jgi:hypothetical protein
MVEVLNVLDRKAVVRDRNGTRHTIAIDLLRYKGEPPAPGEVWYVDRYLGGWSFVAIVGYQHAASVGRQTSTYTTGDLAADESEIGRIALATGFRILSIATSDPARVRLYDTPEDCEADLERAISAYPEPGIGIILDFLTADELLSSSLSPIPEGASMESPANASIPISVTSVSGGQITVTLVWVRTE